MQSKKSNPIKRIGLFGGTFDPVHYGHLIITSFISDYKGLDTIIFIPSARPPHKGSDIMFTVTERLTMLSLAIGDDSRFTLSDSELKREGPSYTIDTIREIKTTFSPDTEFSFILGLDNLYEIEQWKNPQDIISECKLLVALRVCTQTRDLPAWLKQHMEIVSVPLIGISSSDIRQRIRERKSIKYLVPLAVEKEIKRLQKKSHNK
jgi:nicotinate-nucleotide adenylyltransferase